MPFERPTRDDVYMKMAHLIATRGTCRRRQVGCVLVDPRGRILATGYNGVAAGLPHCNQVEWVPRGRPAEHWETKDLATYPHACSGAGSASGTNLDGCEAIHAEQNAILLLSDPWKVESAYVTVSPCSSCIKLLLGTSCTRIVTTELYPHQGAVDLWKQAGREFVYVPNFSWRP